MAAESDTVGEEGEKMKYISVTAMNRPALALTLLLFVLPAVPAQNDPQKPALSVVSIYGLIYYKDYKPDDVPQEAYDSLWEIQKEVIDNFTYDYAALRDSKKIKYMTTKEDFYKYGKGVCENYADFFILLAREKGLTKNLYKVRGDDKFGGGHAWLEYRTAENTYIIDPTWSDDYAFNQGDAQKIFRESPAYGKRAFFITYEEDKIIFDRVQRTNHSSYTIKRTEVALWAEAGET